MNLHDYVPRTFGVSIKGVAVRDGKVLLLKNDRDEWELPGGRIELDETMPEGYKRSIATWYARLREDTR
jgi:ADP-ribose pyrophosphatase YjhB (NUDIX family)